jgi:predicted NodU family carbamoyl transferase
MRSSKLAVNRAQLVQKQWQGNGWFVHSFHRRIQGTVLLATSFPTFYHNLTHSYAQAVHNISAMFTDVSMWFSSEYTGPITTTTTFIYKRIEKEAF